MGMYRWSWIELRSAPRLNKNICKIYKTYLQYNDENEKNNKKSDEASYKCCISGAIPTVRLRSFLCA